MLDIFRHKNNQKGFTLTELLVVIAVIGLLSSIIFAVTRGAGEQGRIAKGHYFSQHLQNSLGSFLVGRWSFDEGTGSTANDTSGWENNGTLVGSPVWRCASIDSNYTPSNQGCSLEFNGSTQYVNAGNATSLQNLRQITYEAWVYNNGSSNIQTIIDKRYFVLSINTSNGLRGVVESTGGGVYFSSSLSIPLQSWSHVVMAYDDNGDRKIYLFVNNASATSAAVTGTLYSDSGFNQWIGRANYLDRWFNGLIDEVRIYNTTLTSAQIEAQYYAGLQRLLAKNLISETEYQQRLVKT
jgi:prepilin-type N-terminal cleavage/methylation domain-containing protein